MSLIKDKKHIDKVCRLGQMGKCCSYFGCGTEGFECFKEVKGLKAHIDKRRAAGTMNAKGDNCVGYLKYLAQNN